MFHATFGAPPVGTRKFAEYFNTKMAPHESWSIAHNQDIVPVCFAWCGSRWYLGWLNWWGGWWNDWSRVGEKRFIFKTDDQEPSLSASYVWEGATNMVFWSPIGLGTFSFLYGSSLLAIPASTIAHIWNRCYYKDKVNPSDTWIKPQLGNDDLLTETNVGTRYHSLEKYIELLKDENVFEVQKPTRETTKETVSKTGRNGL